MTCERPTTVLSCFRQLPRVWVQRPASSRLTHVNQQFGNLGHRWRAQDQWRRRHDIGVHRSLRAGWQDVAVRVCQSAMTFSCLRSASRQTRRPLTDSCQEQSLSESLYNSLCHSCLHDVHDTVAYLSTAASDQTAVNTCFPGGIAISEVKCWNNWKRV